METNEGGTTTSQPLDNEIPGSANISAIVHADNEVDFVKGIDDKKRIAQLEHEIFTVCKQLDERNEKFKEVQHQNTLLNDRVESLEKEKLEKAQFIESVVQSRDTLIFEKTQLQNDKLVLERRKDEFELTISKLTNEKRRHLDEIHQLRKQCETLLADKVELQTHIDNFRSEKATLAYDKEQWNREKEIFLMSKQWYMNEITNREQQLSELRVQMTKEKLEMQREITSMNDTNSELIYNNEQLTLSLANHEKEFNELQEKFKQIICENTTRVNELETELRTRERLTNLYKDSLGTAEKEIEELHDSEKRLDAVLKDKEDYIQNIVNELEELKAKHVKAIEEKDGEIKRLSDEVTRSTELLNAGFRLNRTDEDLIQLSPAAATASSLLKSGMSLTAIYSEHLRVVNELKKKNDEFNQMEKNVVELINDLDSRAPKFQEQRKAYEQMCERNECLRLQNELLSQERQKLQTKTDSLLRELTFTKRELERYQRQHHLLTVQVQRLLYVIEKGAEALDHTYMSGGSVSDECLFSNIKELQSKNIELAEELERLRYEQEKIIEDYHNTKIDSLRKAHDQAQDELSHLKENFVKQELLIREITEQRDQYKNLYDQSAQRAVMSSTASAESDAGYAGQNLHQQQQNINAIQADLLMWRTKAERLQETNDFLNDDRQAHEKILNERIDQQLEQISILRMSIGKLESDLEFQNKNQQLLAKQIDSYSVDLRRRDEQLSDVKRELETSRFKCDSLTNEIMSKQQELSTFSVQNHSLSEQLKMSTSREQRLLSELEILRNGQQSSERISSTLQEMETFLKRVEAEKAHSTESQLQSALLERDNLRQLVDHLNEQHSQLVDGLKSNLNGTCNERDKAQGECKLLQTRLDAVERLYEQLKHDNEKLQSEMEQIQSTDTNIEACKKEMQKMKNTIAYQEKRLAEFEQKCEELNNTIERKDKQLEEICRLGTDLESTMKFGSLENQRLEGENKQLKENLEQSKNTIGELRNSVAAKEMELLDQTKNLSELNNRIEELTTTHAQQLMGLEKQMHETKLYKDQLQSDNEKLKDELEMVNTKCSELLEENLRLTTDLAKEITKAEKLSQDIFTLNIKYEADKEKLQQTIDVLEQEKLRMHGEMQDYIKREEEHIQKRDSLYDEIQKLLKQIEFMERLQNTIQSPSANTSMNIPSMTNTIFSPNSSRLSIGSAELGGQQQQQQTDRINVIIGYMRTEKQKEMELRMNAELEVNRIRAQAGMDQQRIAQLESDNTKLRNEVEINSKALLEKEQLLTRLNALTEIQSRYQQLKKTFDDLNQQFNQLSRKTADLEQQNIKMQADKKNLESRLEVSTKMADDRSQQNKLLRERCERAMAMASKYSPEMVNSLQSDNEKLKSDVVQTNRDLDLHKKECERLSNELTNLKNKFTSLNEQHNTLTATFKEETKKSDMVKQLARKIRDEKNLLNEHNDKLKAELKTTQDELMKLRDTTSTAVATPSTTVGPSATGTTQAENIRKRLQQQVQQLSKENMELNIRLNEYAQIENERDRLLAQINNMQREIDDSAEKVMRVEMVEKAYKNNQQKVQSLTAEIKQLQEENVQLRRRVLELEEQLTVLQQMQQQQQQQSSLLSSTNRGDPQSFSFYDEPPQQQQQILNASQQLGIIRSAQLMESPQSPPHEQLSVALSPRLDEGIIDELDKEVATGQPTEGEIGEGILDIEGEEELHLSLDEQSKPTESKEQSFHQETDIYNADDPEHDQQHPIEEYEAETGFGDIIQSDLGPETYAFREEVEELEERYEDEELCDEDEEEDENSITGDEEIVDEGDEIDEYTGDEQQPEEIYNMAENESNAHGRRGGPIYGEPPRKQMRFVDQQQQQLSTSGTNTDPTEEQSTEEKNDDDDDIQLL